MIYFMLASETGHIKIGWSINPVNRYHQVKPRDVATFTIVRLIEGQKWVERWFHQQFEANRLNGEREWFTFNPGMLTLEPPAELPQTKTGPTTTTPSGQPAPDRAATLEAHHERVRQARLLLAQQQAQESPQPKEIEDPEEPWPVPWDVLDQIDQAGESYMPGQDRETVLRTIIWLGLAEMERQANE